MGRDALSNTSYYFRLRVFHEVRVFLSVFSGLRTRGGSCMKPELGGGGGVVKPAGC